MQKGTVIRTVINCDLWRVYWIVNDKVIHWKDIHWVDLDYDGGYELNLFVGFDAEDIGLQWKMG